MAYDNLNGLRQLAAAADVPTFLHLVSSDSCWFTTRKLSINEFEELQRRGYSALVLAALSKGLLLFNAAVAAEQLDSPPSSVVSRDLQHLMFWLQCLAGATTSNMISSLLHGGEGSAQAKNMEQEVLDSGAHAKQQCCTTATSCAWLCGTLLSVGT